MEKEERPQQSNGETKPNDLWWKNFDFMLATFPFGKMYMYGEGEQRYISPKNIASAVYNKADEGIGLGLLWFAQGHLLIYGGGGYLFNGITDLVSRVHSLGVRAWRTIKQPFF